ncbi:MAG: hypothetical protein IJ740_07960 [Ruminococcus sp.]|nr:hypothetical protein [Ruminococcus sp.]
MVYTDLFFILALLPLSVIFSFFDDSAEYKNLISVITGAIFVAWGRPLWVLLIFLSFIVDWGCALMVQKYRDDKKAASVTFLMLDMLFNFAIFIIYTRGGALHLPDKLTIKESLIPLAMGYYVLRAFSYVYDVYKGEKAEKNPLYLLTYMLSMHFMMCGPVIRYKDISAELKSRKASGKMLSDGIDNVVYGLAKVVILAHALELLKLTGLEGRDITFFGCWFGMAAFFGQMYFTLSGLCQIGYGCGLLNGFTYKKNFDDIDSSALFTGLVKGYNTSVTGLFDEMIISRFRYKTVPAAIAAFVCCMAVAGWYGFSKPVFLTGAIVGAVVVLEKLVYGKKLRTMPAAVRYIYLVILSMLIFSVVYFGNTYGWRKWALGLVGVGNKYMMSKQMKTVLLGNLFVYIIGLISFLPALRELVLTGIKKLQSRSKELYTLINTSKTLAKALLLIMCISAIIVRKL